MNLRDGPCANSRRRTPLSSRSFSRRNTFRKSWSEATRCLQILTSPPGPRGSLVDFELRGLAYDSVEFVRPLLPARGLVMEDLRSVLEPVRLHAGLRGSVPQLCGPRPVPEFMFRGPRGRPREDVSLRRGRRRRDAVVAWLHVSRNRGQWQ